MAMTDTLGKSEPETVARPARSRTTLWLLTPGVIWMVLFLALPILMMIYISFWTQTTFAIKPTLTVANWVNFFSSPTYLGSQALQFFEFHDPLRWLCPMHLRPEPGVQAE